jgi:pimeloyl-ACP methyl ester carboxylesterase
MTGAPVTASTATTANSAPPALSRGVRRITLDAAGLRLSALLAEPRETPRAVVVALHGAGMSAGYFDGQAHPEVSLLALAMRLGFTVLAVDRPGYGASAPQLPEGQRLSEQSRALRAALDGFAARHPVGAGFFLLAHSFGGKLALTLAAEHPDRDLLGLDVSGCGHRYAVAAEQLRGGPQAAHWKRNWGALGLYPPGTFRGSEHVVVPVPREERTEGERWPERFPELAARIRVPVRFTFAEQESWWRHDRHSVAELAARLHNAPRVLVDRQPRAGHNISLGWAARAYHLRALGFLEECLLHREAAGAVPSPGRSSATP